MRRPFCGYWIVLAAFLCNTITFGCGSYAFSLFVTPPPQQSSWGKAIAPTTLRLPVWAAFSTTSLGSGLFVIPCPYPPALRPMPGGVLLSLRQAIRGPQLAAALISGERPLSISLRALIQLPERPAYVARPKPGPDGIALYADFGSTPSAIILSRDSANASIALLTSSLLWAADMTKNRPPMVATPRCSR